MVVDPGLPIAIELMLRGDTAEELQATQDFMNRLYSNRSNVGDSLRWVKLYAREGRADGYRYLLAQLTNESHAGSHRVGEEMVKVQRRDTAAMEIVEGLKLNEQGIGFSLGSREERNQSTAMIMAWVQAKIDEIAR